jgi:hypothetical protein
MPCPMRFTCHLLSDGRFYPAGTEIPPEVAVPGGAMQYAETTVSDIGVHREPQLFQKLQEELISSAEPTRRVFL